MPHCPCCSDSLLHHIRGTESYWFCRSCWQEMPVLSKHHSLDVPEPILATLAKKIAPPKHTFRLDHPNRPNSLQSRLEGNWHRRIIAKVPAEL